MSLYCFIAGDKKMSSLSVGVDDQGHRIVIEDEKHILNIYEDEQYYFIKQFTDKPVIMGMDIGLDFSTVAEDLLSYIQLAMADNIISIELWQIWIGTVSLGDRATEKRSVLSNELTVDDLCWIFGEREYSHPKCLKVFKWIKGKR